MFDKELPSSAEDHPRSRLVSHLLKLATDADEKGDRGPLAELRRGASCHPHYPPSTLRHVAGLFDEQTSITEQDTMLLIATLFALNPAKVDAPWQQDLGAVLREVGQKRGGDEGVKAVERRFLALLGASPDELPTFLRHAISLAATEEVPISWQRLYQDVLKLMKNYEDARQDVIRKWSRSFWKKAAATEKSNDETTSDSEN